MTNYDRLVEAGIINPAAGTKPSDSDMKAIEGLSAAEVDHLITAKSKLGNSFMDQHAAPGQSFFVF
ncbi:MAG: hypothetical protein JST05_01975 [Acidobacteria bacterium]|nr:hypothetical protein [Acidobacteriota bacterium]